MLLAILGKVFVEGAKNEDLVPVLKQTWVQILNDHCKQQLAAISECKVYLDNAVYAYALILVGAAIMPCCTATGGWECDGVTLDIDT